MKDLQCKSLPIVYPTSSKKEKQTNPYLNPKLVISLPTINEIRKKYRPSILSPLRQRM